MSNVLITGKLDTDRTKVQEVFVNSDGQLSIQLLSGELQNYNRLAGGAIAGYTQVSTSAGQTIKSGTGLLYGIHVVAVGTSPTITIYDNTTAAGVVLMQIPTASIVAGATITFSGIGMATSNGIHVVVGGTGTTTVNVMYV